MHTVQSQISIPAMLGDTGRTLRISLSDGSKPYVIADGCLAKVSIKRPTGTRLEDFCTIERNTTIVYPFSENTCATEGIHDCDVTLYGLDGNIITSPRFSMVVSERVVKSDDIVITDTDQTAVDAMLVKEAERQAAEEERKANEDIRKANEEERKANAEAVAKAVEDAQDACESAKAYADEAKENAGLFTALEDRITALEGGTGTLYFYNGLVDAIGEAIDEGYDDGFYIRINGKIMALDDAFWSKCTHVDFGGSTEESGAYLYHYEGTVELGFYEVIEVYANGEWVETAGGFGFSCTAPEVVHLTTHD